MKNKPLKSLIEAALKTRPAPSGVIVRQVPIKWAPAWKMYYAAKAEGFTVDVVRNGPEIKSIELYKDDVGQISLKRGDFGGFVLNIHKRAIEVLGVAQ